MHAWFGQTVNMTVQLAERDRHIIGMTHTVEGRGQEFNVRTSPKIARVSQWRCRVDLHHLYAHPAGAACGSVHCTSQVAIPARL